MKLKVYNMTTKEIFGWVEQLTDNKFMLYVNDRRSAKIRHIKLKVEVINEP